MIQDSQWPTTLLTAEAEGGALDVREPEPASSEFTEVKAYCSALQDLNGNWEALSLPLERGPPDSQTQLSPSLPQATSSLNTTISQGAFIFFQVF